MDKTKFEKAVIWATREVEGRGWIAEDYLSVFGDFLRHMSTLPARSTRILPIRPLSESWSGCPGQIWKTRFPWSRPSIRTSLGPISVTPVWNVITAFTISFLDVSVKCGYFDGQKLPE